MVTVRPSLASRMTCRACCAVSHVAKISSVGGSEVSSVIIRIFAVTKHVLHFLHIVWITFSNGLVYKMVHIALGVSSRLRQNLKHVEHLWRNRNARPLSAWRSRFFVHLMPPVHHRYFSHYNDAPFFVDSSQKINETVYAVLVPLVTNVC